MLQLYLAAFGARRIRHLAFENDRARFGRSIGTVWL